MGGAGRRGGGGRNRRRGICDRPRPGHARASRPDHGAAAGRGRQSRRAAVRDDGDRPGDRVARPARPAGLVRPTVRPLAAVRHAHVQDLVRRPGQGAGGGPGVHGRDRRAPGRPQRLALGQPDQQGDALHPAGRSSGRLPEYRHGAERPDAAADRQADPGRSGLHNHRRPSAERDRRGPARLPALAGAQGQPLADRAGQDRHRREQLASAAGAGLRARRGQSRVQRGLHLALVRQARRVQLRVLPAAGREGEDGHGPGRRAIRTVGRSPACRTCPPAVFTPAARVPRRPARSFSG